jgi:hypothetical protein
MYPDKIFRAMQTRGLIGIYCQLFPSYLEIALLCLEYDFSGDFTLVNTDKQTEKITIIIPNLERGEYRNIQLLRGEMNEETTLQN